MTAWLVLRRTWCLRLLPVVWIVTVALLFTRSTWRWEVAAASGWATVQLLVLAPIMAGLAAFDARTFSSTTPQAMVGGLPRRPGPLTQLLGLAFCCLFSTWLVAEGVAVSVAARGGGAFEVDPWQAVEAAGVCLAFSALGVAVGQRVDSILAAPAAAVLALLASPLLSLIGNWAAFRINGTTGWVAGLIRSPGPVLIALTVNVVVSWVLVRLLTRQVRSRLSNGLDAAVLVVALVVPAFIPFTAYAVDPAPRFTCQETAPRVCVLRGHEGYLRPLAAQVGAGAAALRPLGIQPADEYREVADSAQAPPGVAFFAPQLTVAGDPEQLTAAELADVLSLPNACPAEVDDALAAVRFDFATALTPYLETGRVTDAQAARIRELYVQLRECRP